MPKPETMLAYASILEKPQYWVDPKTGQKYLLATGEIVEAACAALRFCAAVAPTCDDVVPMTNNNAAIIEQVEAMRRHEGA